MRRLTRIGGLACLLVLLGFVFVAAGRSGNVRSVGKGPKIEFDELEWNFGKIHDGDIVDHVFVFRNSGSDTLHILDVRASCGCTAALASSSQIPPGGRGEIKATFNSRGKRGIVRKTITVTTNETAQPAVTLNLVADIGAPIKVHATMDMHGSYLEGKCANCHVERGLGKSGAPLFAADCAMCHGEYGTGGVAFALNDAAYLQKVDDGHLKERITKGSPTNPMMLGFGKPNGGPLTDDQIESLVRFIRSWQNHN